ncbi:MAG: diaminopimelate epimerase [Salibacteraceae bacterium]
MNFWKYQGAGNDFVMVDDREELFDIENFETIERICDRRFGIGADGLILLRNSKSDLAQLEMVYFNSDGRQSSMCGNGGRCFAAFALHLGLVKNKFTFLAIDGPHEADFIGDLVNLKMIDVETIEKIGDDYFLDTGSPHYVSRCFDIENLDLLDKAKNIRFNDRFKNEGTNVNFVEYKADYLDVRTYERGVEDETLACGTGVTAVALVADILNRNTSGNKSRIKVRGGELEVSYEKRKTGYKNIWLKGPAEMVFKGNTNL